ncbi:ABC transporter ATP-binding protein [Fusibacter sp. 3D3]|uniref:ABC transporter ATP-binding protein n=1 Tax=Fusibacter sp. 3D3 TaxID=1048380 RepID=UPI0008532BA4|nr:dipeptide/oligopeptide/nickel ABC transporter ATP-binding protein [Fusibacter sp. 3D3]GAU76576.1 oligopeptide transport ATP-binding protein OppF [Fusibacter sp. 3D3]
MNANLILEMKEIHKTFKGNTGENRQVLKAVNIEVKAGECVGIVGESGSGKSTLAKLIVHLIPATKGQIFFKGKDITCLSKKELKAYYRKVQMVFQEPLSTFSPKMKIGTYLSESFIHYENMKKSEAHKRALELLKMVGLCETYINKYPHELSGGELQRVVIARSIGINPDLIICDEATSALDVSLQKQIIELLMNFKKNNQFSTLFITHDLALAERLCDRTYVMYQGEIVEVLKGNDIVESAVNPYTRKLLESVFNMKKIKEVLEAV